MNLSQDEISSRYNLHYQVGGANRFSSPLWNILKGGMKLENNLGTAGCGFGSKIERLMACQ